MIVIWDWSYGIIKLLWVFLNVKCRVEVQGQGPGHLYGHVMDFVAQRYLVTVNGNDGEGIFLFHRTRDKRISVVLKFLVAFLVNCVYSACLGRSS